MITRRFGLSLSLILVSLAAVLLSLGLGSVAISPDSLFSLLTGSGTPLERTIVLDLRLPRTLSAFAVGGLLALAGALLQVLLRNPLADPYVLGVSGGASVAALTALLLGWGTAWVSTGAFLGALFSMALVFGLSRSRGPWTPTRLLLTGVVIAAGWGALISLLLALSPDTHVRSMLFWLMGDMSYARHPLLGHVVLWLGLILCLPMARSLNLLIRGELTAASLGIRVSRLRLAIYILSSVFTAAAVTLAGGVGFVGLIIPHILRLISGNDHRRLLPHCVLLGGSFLVIADTLARTIMAPQQLPVGVITALMGVPAFLWLLGQGQQRQ
ncbi:MAG: iron ABC transporter permease [Gammaproteobacteria bacterium]|nr:iron ABC transporter permease [Gammaproteobacteria bacterium]